MEVIMGSLPSASLIRRGRCSRPCQLPRTRMFEISTVCANPGIYCSICNVYMLSAPYGPTNPLFQIQSYSVRTPLSRGKNFP